MVEIFISGPVTLYQGDALTVLAGLPAGCVDAVLTDPPYSSGGLTLGERQAEPAQKYRSTGYKRVFPAIWLAECWRLCREGAPLMVFTDWRQLPALSDALQAAGWIWREEDAPAKLAEGMLSEEAWLEICATKAAEEHAAWLADPETQAERFEMLRQARDARLAATDYLVAPDYPLTDEQRAAVIAYRQVLRDLPAQEDAPWDGGGEATPWPDAPAVAMAQEADDAPADS